MDALFKLFFALVRSRLEYGSLIWYPVYKVHINYIESVQRRFLKFAYYLQNHNYPQRGYDQSLLLSKFNFNSLKTRGVILTIKFLVNLVKGQIDCPYLFEKLSFLVPRTNSRQSFTFYCGTSRTNILRKSPVSNMCNLFNIFFLLWYSFWFMSACL